MKTEFQYSLPIHFLLKELRNPFRKNEDQILDDDDFILVVVKEDQSNILLFSNCFWFRGVKIGRN